MECKERYYELIGEIVAYPDTAISFTRPFSDPKKYISESDFSTTESQKTILPVKSGTGKLKETPSVGVNGESYEVTVTFDIEKVTADVYDKLDVLKKGINHLIIRTFPDNKMLVRSTEYAYYFQYKENDGNLQCEFSIQNLCGAQRVL